MTLPARSVRDAQAEHVELGLMPPSIPHEQVITRPTLFENSVDQTD
jgi:hypothetical protein